MTVQESQAAEVVINRFLVKVYCLYSATSDWLVQRSLHMAYICKVFGLAVADGPATTCVSPVAPVEGLTVALRACIDLMYELPGEVPGKA
jgi:hypothetical protein